MTDITEPTGGSVQLFLPISHVSQTNPDQAVWAMQRVVTALGRLWHGFDLQFVVSCPGDHTIKAGWLIQAADLAAAHDMADDVRDVSRSVAPWLGLSHPTDQEPWPPIGPLSHFFVPGLNATTALITRWSPAWAVAIDGDQPWALVIELGGVVDADPDGDPVAPDKISCRLRLHGSGRRRDLMAALIADDIRGAATLIAEPARTSREAPFVDLPIDLIAHLLATPQRVRGAFDELPPVSTDSLFEMLTRGPTPHLMVLGGSGQGKTTFLEHLADRASAAGEPVVAVDVHDGAFGRQVHNRATLHRTDPCLVDLAGDTDACLQLTAPPPGISPARWADDLFEILRGVLWSDAPEEYFGPVGRRAVMLCLHALIRDPAGPHPLTQLPQLLDVSAPRFRTELLERIGDETLQRSFITEVLPMLTAKEPGNSAIWIISKFEPLIGNAAVRRLTTGHRDTVPIEILVDQGRPIVVLAPTGQLGEAGARIAVSVILHRLWLAVRRRAIPNPIHILLDEWQQYPIPTIGSLLSEGRKFGVKLRLANQNLAQVPPSLRQAALANIGLLAAFRTGPHDARELDGMFKSVTVNQLQTLRPHQLAVAGGEHDLLMTAPPPLDRPPALRIM